MKIYLATLNEKQKSWEGERFISRVSGLLNHSNRHHEVNNPAQADIIVFLESNSFRSKKSISNLRNTDLLRKWAYKSYAINYGDGPVDFLPGLYVSLPHHKHNVRWTRAIPYPWPSPNPIISKFNTFGEDPDFNLTFRGSLSHPVRKKLVEVILESPELGPCQTVNRWFNHTKEEQYDYLQEIAKSKFVACPRGVATSSYRLYETLNLGRVPVIISDEWFPPESIDWNACSIRIAEDRIQDISMLINQSLTRWPQMSDTASRIWNEYLGDDVLGDYMFGQLESLFWTREPNTDWSYLERRWRTTSFKRRNEWDILSKLKRLKLRMHRRAITN